MNCFGISVMMPILHICERCGQPSNCIWNGKSAIGTLMMTDYMMPIAVSGQAMHYIISFSLVHRLFAEQRDEAGPVHAYTPTEAMTSAHRDWRSLPSTGLWPPVMFSMARSLGVPAASK